MSSFSNKAAYLISYLERARVSAESLPVELLLFWQQEVSGVQIQRL